MKSNEIAFDLRNEGNSFYKERIFHEALIKYNKSLCFSENESENQALAYANRSAICLELKKLQKCLLNIKLARSSNYPKESMEVLENREKKCIELLKKNKNFDQRSFLKLSHKPSKAIPYIIDGLELKINDKYGRHIVTNKELHVGDIIAIEKPFCSVLLTQSNFVEVDGNNKYLRCAHCLKTNGYELVPCPDCCHAMFCESCHKEAYQKYHKFECPIMHLLLTSGSVHIALRIFFIALSSCKESITEMQNFLMKIDASDKNFSIFDFNVKDTDNTQNYLRYLNTLSRSSNKFSMEQYEKILKKHPILNEIYDNNKEFIKEFIQRQCQTNDHYFHGIFGPKVNLSSREVQDLQQSIGSGWYPFCSLINHSCASNVMRIYVDGKICLFVSRSIPKGSQIFDCYKVSFTKHSMQERQLKLLKQFNFTCECEACLLDFQRPPNLAVKDMKLAKIAKKIEDECSRMEHVNENFFRDCCKHMDANHKNFPSLELVFLQKSFAFMLLLIARNESLN